jgi:hypothetical protein
MAYRLGYTYMPPWPPEIYAKLKECRKHFVTPLQIAPDGGHEAVMQLLIENNAIKILSSDCGQLDIRPGPRSNRYNLTGQGTSSWDGSIVRDPTNSIYTISS